MMVASLVGAEVPVVPLLGILYLSDRVRLLLLLSLQLGQLLLQVSVSFYHAPQDHVVFRPVPPNWDSPLDLAKVYWVVVHW